MIGAVLLIPQALYYKTVSGQWWWYAYGNERLDLLHPHLLGGWFDYKNGWLVYTPVMVFALIGIFRLRRFVRPALTPMLVVLPLHAYIAYSIGGAGSTPMALAPARWSIYTLYWLCLWPRFSRRTGADFPSKPRWPFSWYFFRR